VDNQSNAYGQSMEHAKKYHQDDINLQKVLAIRANLPPLGTRKQDKMTRSVPRYHGIEVERDYLFDLLGAQKLKIRKRKCKVITMD
jgi:putative transposase